MALGKDTEPVMVYLDRKTVERIDYWAERLGQSRSKMAGCLIHDAIVECGIEYNVITSAPSIALINLVRQCNGKAPIGLPVDESLKQGRLPAA